MVSSPSHVEPITTTTQKGLEKDKLNNSQVVVEEAEDEGFVDAEEVEQPE